MWHLSAQPGRLGTLFHCRKPFGPEPTGSRCYFTGTILGWQPVSRVQPGRLHSPSASKPSLVCNAEDAIPQGGTAHPAAVGLGVHTVTLHAVGAAPLDSPIYIQFRPSAKPAADIWAYALEALAAITRFQRTARCNSRRAPR
jgi:hypothetical protein